MKIAFDHCFQRNKQIMGKEMADGFVLIDPYRRTMIELNEIAREIWKLLDGTLPVKGIMEALAEKFAVEEKILRHDVTDFLKSLLEREMIF